MPGKTSIEWATDSWNVVRGCALVSHGCTNCYAMRQAHRFSGEGMPYAGLTKMTSHGPVWTGDVRTVPELLDWPLRLKKPRRIFVNSMSDLFHEDVPEAFIDSVFTRMMMAKQHTFQVLTKRPQRMLEYVTSLAHAHGDIVPSMAGWPLPNVWLGVSVEDQATADERIPLLLQTPAAVRWISAEPLLGPINLEHVRADALAGCRGSTFDARGGNLHIDGDDVGLDWVVVGGESGPGARPMHPDWARSLRDQCIAAGVPLLFKQWGEWAVASTVNGYTGGSSMTTNNAWWVHRDGATTKPSCLRDGAWPDDGNVIAMWKAGKKAAGRTLDGRTWDQYPT